MTTSAMREALRLTRAGNLTDATTMLREAVSGSSMRSKAADLGVIIDLKPVRAPSPTARSETAKGRFLQCSYRGAEGALDYRQYIPADARPMMPLVVMLHGCTQNPDDFARGTDMNRLADDHGFVVAYPGQTRTANAQGCWNWFRPEDQQRGRGEPALIAGVTRAVVEEQGCDPARVYVAGLSAGGAAAAIMGAAYPDIYAAIGVHSGLACGSARDMPSAFAAMRNGNARTATPARFVPVITFHGDKDATVNAINSRQIIAAATAAAGELTTRTETGTSARGRGYTRTIGTDDDGKTLIEQWTVHGAGHAWSGGSGTGSYTDPDGPDASREMIRFFLASGG